MKSLFQPIIKRILPLSLALGLVIGMTVPALGAPTIPEPTDIFYVGDFAGVLTEDTVDHIVEKNQDLNSRSGAQIVVVTVEFLGGADIENYARLLFNNWGIGDADKDNGVLLLLVIGEENYWCVQGKGLEQKLSSGRIDDLLYDYLETDFAAGQYDDGTYKVFDALYKEVSKLYPTEGAIAPVPGEREPSYDSSSYDSGYSYGSVFIGVLVIVLLIVLLSFFSTFRRRRRVYYDGGGYYSGPPPYRRPPIMPPPPPRYPPPPPPSGGGFFGSGGFFGNGSSRGGGAGRSSGSSSSSSSSSSRSSGSSRSFSSGRSSSSRSSGGGGSTRGGGAGRRGR